MNRVYAASLLEDIRRGRVPFSIEGDDVFVVIDGRQMQVTHEPMKAQIRLIFATREADPMLVPAKGEK